MKKRKRNEYILLVKYHPLETWQTASAEIFNSFKEAKQKALKIFIERYEPKYVVQKYIEVFENARRGKTL